MDRNPIARVAASRQPLPFLVLSIALTTLAGFTVRAASSDAAPAPAPGEPAALRAAAAAPVSTAPEVAALPLPPVPAALLKPRPLSPMATEMARVIEAGNQTLVTLQARFKRATNDREALAIQRELEQAKRDIEISLLRIQAAWARREGRLAVAREIEAEIENILHPPAAPAATPRVDRDGGR